MELLERCDELTKLHAMLAACAEEGGGAALVAGGIGCGKTELVEAVKARAARTGFRVLAASGSWAESKSPGSLLNQLLRHADGPLAPPQLDAEVGWVEEDGSRLSPATTAILHDLRAAVLRSAVDQPVLVCVDDVQFADEVSQHWLMQLLHRLRRARIAVVLAQRITSKPLDVRLRSALLRQENYHRITLSRLSESGVAALLRRYLDDGTADAVAAECYAASGGNPLLVRALAEDHAAAEHGDRSRARLAVGDAYADVILGCLDDDRSVLLPVASALATVDAEQVAPELLLHMVPELDAATVHRGMAALTAAGLLDGTRLRHPVARDAVLATVATSRRAELHRRAARWLYQNGSAAAAIAPHLLGAGDDLPSWAPSVLRDAAEDYLCRSDAMRANACLDLAVRFPQSDAEQMSTKVKRAAAAWLLNPCAGERHLGELRTALAGGQLPVQEAIVVIRHLLWHGHFAEADTAIARIRRSIPDVDAAAALDIRAELDAFAASYPGVVCPDTADDPARGRHRPAEGADPRIGAVTSLIRIMRDGPDDRAAAVASASMRAMRLSKRTQQWLVCGVAALMLADRNEAASQWCEQWLAESRERQVPLWEAEFSMLQSTIALRLGKPVLASHHAEAALAKVPVEGWGASIGAPLACLIQAATERGDLDAAAAYLEIPVPDSMLLTASSLYYLHARSRYHMQVDRPQQALADLLMCGEMMRRWGIDQPSIVPWRAEAARAYLMIEDAVRATALTKEQMALVANRPGRTRGMSLRALAATVPGESRVRLLREAVRDLQKAGDHTQLAAALGDLGQAYQQSGRVSQARSVVQMAARLVDACGAHLVLRGLPMAELVSSARAANCGGDVADRYPRLSRAERRVADLAAEGYTNREIAQKLRVTVSTVEQHLTRVFRKLGVKARYDLPQRPLAEDRLHPNGARRPHLRVEEPWMSSGAARSNVRSL